MQPSQYLLKSSRDYAIYVCRTRAIPFVGDGLKHGQMIALWLLRNRAEKIRTFALSGLMAFERLYVHGETSANDAIGLLAAPYKNNVPLIQGEGHFGSRIDPDAIGAPRYTDVKRSKAAEALLYRDLDIVPLEDNYDGSNKQPQHFLPLIPLVLLNGISGTGVGWSTNILPHDLKALIEATKLALLEKPLKPLPPYYANYDIDITCIGPNRWELTGRVRIIDSTTVQITELPPGMKIETFRKRLIDMENNGSIRSYIDRSTEAIDITVRLKSSQLTEIVDGKLVIAESKTMTEKEAIEFFKLRERITERIVVIGWDGQRIITYNSPEEVVVDFVKWRLGWYTKRFEYMLQRDTYELQYWLTLRALFDDKNFLKKLGTFENKEAVLTETRNIASKRNIPIDDVQMDRIVNLPTYRWTQEFSNDVNASIASLNTAIKEYEATLASPEKLRQVYITELDELKKLT